MNTSDLVKILAARTGVSQADARTKLTELVEAIVYGLRTEGRVHVAGLGTFQRKKRASRRQRNPSTGEIMEVPATLRVTFTPGEQLKRRAEKRI